MNLITNKNQNRSNKNKDNGLTLVNSSVVSDGCWSWLRSVTIPMDGIKRD